MINNQLFYAATSPAHSLLVSQLFTYTFGINNQQHVCRIFVTQNYSEDHETSIFHVKNNDTFFSSLSNPRLLSSVIIDMMTMMILPKKNRRNKLWQFILSFFFFSKVMILRSRFLDARRKRRNFR